MDVLRRVFTDDHGARHASERVINAERNQPRHLTVNELQRALADD